MNFEMSPLSGSESDSVSIPYSRMTEEDAQLAYSTRKEQIKAMLKARSSIQTPDSNDSKYSVSSMKSRQSTQTAKNAPIRFTATPKDISKHSIDLSLQSQQELRDRLKTKQVDPPQVQPKKYDTKEPLYKRTVEWKQNLNKKKEELHLCKKAEDLNQCTFEPSIDRSEIRNLSVGIYTRNQEWKSEIIKKHEAMQDLSKLKELQECSFQPKLVSANLDFSENFYQRNEIWKERLFKKAKKIEEEATKDQVFYPKIIRPRAKAKKEKVFESRFDMFLSKLDEISEKIDKSLANSVM